MENQQESQETPKAHDPIEAELLSYSNKIKAILEGKETIAYVVLLKKDTAHVMRNIVSGAEIAKLDTDDFDMFMMQCEAFSSILKKESDALSEALDKITLMRHIMSILKK